MKCANCVADARYTYRVTADFKIHYCDKHLPRFLASQKAAGLLQLDVIVPEVPKTSKKKTVEEAPVEPVEEAPTDADN